MITHISIWKKCVSSWRGSFMSRNWPRHTIICWECLNAIPHGMCLPVVGKLVLFSLLLKKKKTNLLLSYSLATLQYRMCGQAPKKKYQCASQKLEILIQIVSGGFLFFLQRASQCFGFHRLTSAGRGKTQMSCNVWKPVRKAQKAMQGAAVSWHTVHRKQLLLAQSGGTTWWLGQVSAPCILARSAGSAAEAPGRQCPGRKQITCCCFWLRKAEQERAGTRGLASVHLRLDDNRSE